MFCFLIWALLTQMCPICETSSSYIFPVCELAFRITRYKEMFTWRKPQTQKTWTRWYTCGMKMKDNWPSGNLGFAWSWGVREDQCWRRGREGESADQTLSVRGGPEVQSWAPTQVLTGPPSYLSILDLVSAILFRLDILVHMHCLFGLYSCNFQMPKPLPATASGHHS